MIEHCLEFARDVHQPRIWVDLQRDLNRLACADARGLSQVAPNRHPQDALASARSAVERLPGNGATQRLLTRPPFRRERVGND
jgi:hypothetical protein